MTLTHALSRLSALLLGCAAALPALATDLQTAPLHAEILPGWQQADGTRIAGLKLTLAPGWKTYWRAPGDAGIPPQFNWSGSDNLRDVEVTFPTPGVFLQGGMRSIGYKHEVVFPLRIAPQSAQAPVTLRAHVELGVCSDICVPQTVSLEATLASDSRQPTPAIAAALAQRPLSAAEAGVRRAACDLRPAANGLEIETHVDFPALARDEVVVIEPGHPDIWMSETISVRNGSTLVSRGTMEALSGSAFALDRSAVRITILGNGQAVEIEGCAPS
jgi:DsbC/DsbD-like thiol-disulfide interchange protein